MRHFILGLLLLVTAGSISCHRADQVDPEPDPRKGYTKDVVQANTLLVGKWKLTKVYASVPNPAVPNVYLAIDQTQISLIQDNRQTDLVNFQLVESDYGILIQTNAQPRADNWYVRNPSLFITQKRLFLDLGMAQDLPAYIFDKVE